MQQQQSQSKDEILRLISISISIGMTWQREERIVTEMQSWSPVCMRQNVDVVVVSDEAAEVLKEKVRERNQN